MNQKSTSAPIAENKMGTMPVGRIVLNMSLPMMISMLVQALYNIPVWLKLSGFPDPWIYSSKTILCQPGT